MFRKPPGVLFLSAIVAVCVYVLASSWTVGGLSEEYGFYVFLVLLSALLATGVRTFLALRGPREGKTAVARIAAGPVLMFIALVLLASNAPGDLRLALSKDSLDRYARTVNSENCDHRSFRPRQVGLYTVVCATHVAGVVGIYVDDPLTPDGTGMWLLVGPGDWEFGVQD
ncbi:hypothetical protein ACQP1W_26530 [Spirillospora sp. CA-255316]